MEHSLDEKITFFHFDCLSSEVRLNVDFDLTLTVVAAMLYQRLADNLKGFNRAIPQTIFRRFINTHGKIEITNQRDRRLLREADAQSHSQGTLFRGTLGTYQLARRSGHSPGIPLKLE